MPINQMTKNKDRPHSYVFAQVGRGIIWESALHGRARYARPGGWAQELLWFGLRVFG